MEFSQSKTKTKIKSFGNETFNSDSSELSATYAYNLGYFEVFGGLAIQGGDAKGTYYGAGVMVNAIENAPGNDLIPYAIFAFGNHDEDFEGNGSDYNLEGNSIQYGLGLKWYPFGELFAFNLSLVRFQADYSVSSDSLPKGVKAEVMMDGIHLSYILSF